MNSLHLRASLWGGAVFVLAAACSSSPPPEKNPLATKNASSKGDAGEAPEGDGTPGGDQPTTPSGPSGPPTGASDGGTNPPTDAGTTACGSTGDSQSCMDCCTKGNTNALAPAIQAFGDCACVSPGTCADQCAFDYCIGLQPSDTCSQCLDGATQCQQAGDKACNADATCRPALACERASQCNAMGGGP
jgi:hypothetical protein